MTTFNIGSQRAETINNVAGDMIVGELGRLSRELERADLPVETKQEVQRVLQDANPDDLGSRLQRVTQVLDGAGGVAKAGIGVADALKSLAVLVGIVL